MNNQKGQILIEAIVMGAAYFVLLGGLFSCLLFVWNKVWIDHHLYETLICLQSTQSAPLCRSHFAKTSKPGVIGFKIEDVTWNPSKNIITAHAVSALKSRHQFQKTIQTRGL